MSSTKFVFFGPIGKNKMAALPSDRLRHFRLFLWNRWTEFNKTLQEATSQCPLPNLFFFFLDRSEKQDGIFDFSSETAEQNLTKLTGKWSQFPLQTLCLSGRSEKRDYRPGLWLADTFSTSPLKPQNGIQRNLRGSKISISSTKFMGFFRADWKNKMAGRASDWLKIFDFSSETAEGNSTKIDRNSVSSSKFVFFGSVGKQDGRPGLWLAETFSSPLKSLKGIQQNLTGSKISTSSTKFVSFGPIGPPPPPAWSLIGWDILDISSETSEQNSTNLEKKVSTSSTKFVIFWQIENQDGHTGLWFAETFSIFPHKLLNGIQRNLTWS